MQVAIEESPTTVPHQGGANADEVVVSSRISTAAALAARGQGEEDVTIGKTGRAARPLKESSRKLLAALDPADVEAEGDALEETGGADKPAEGEGKPDAAPEPHPDTVRADRLTEHNRKLLAENAELRAKPTRGELTTREKALHEAEANYFADPLAAHRRLIAAAHGTDDLKSKQVQQELEDLLEELTSEKIGVPLTREADDSRKVRRTLAALERDKRESKAATAPAAAETNPDAAILTKMSSFIGDQLAASGHAEKFPLLTALAEDFHGLKPAALLSAAIHEGFATGELDRKTPDAQLIEHVSKHFEKVYETRFQALAEKVGKAKPSTAAKPAAATESTGKNASPTGKAARTITNESASVAPATPPAKKKSPSASGKPVRGDYGSEAAFRAAVIAHYG